MAEREGQQFGNYRLVRLLGRGAFAEVYLAVQVFLGTEAAIKVLHTQLANAADIEKFRMEARTIATLTHPHIVRVLDFGVQDGTPYLLMDYAPNGSLRQLFPAGTPLAPATILPYLKQIAEALQYAHDQRLIHRDVKPENMLLSRSNGVLLSDFGIALVAQSSNYQETQSIAGTASYMAPEQLQGKPRPASDQYALGVVVYEWLSGSRPFHGTFTEVAGQHMLAAPRPLREKIPTLSPAVERVVLTALAKDPKERFASIRAFANALEQATLVDNPQTYATRAQTPPSPAGRSDGPQPSIYAAETVISALPGIPVPPPPQTTAGSGPPIVGPTVPASVQPGGPSGYAPAFNAGWAANTPSSPAPYADTFMSMAAPASPLAPAPGQTPPKKGISRRAVVIGGAAGLALIGGGAAAFLLLPKGSGTAGTVVGSSPTAAGTGAATATAAPTETATSAPTETPTTPPQPGSTLYTYRGHTQAVATLEWSPGGLVIVSGSYDHTVRIWNATNGNTLITYKKHTDQVWTVAGSSDSKYMASGGKDRAVHVWDPHDGNPVGLGPYTGHSGEIADLTWSPNNKLIASASYDNTVRVWEALTQQFIFTYSNHTDHVWSVDWSPDGSLVASGSKDKTVHLWNPTNGTGTVVNIYKGHNDGVAAVAWSPNGKRIASGSYDRTVQVWDATTGNNVVTYSGHSGDVTGVAWSPDGRYIASSSKDGTVHVWNASNATRVLVYRQHSSAVSDVGWGPNGKRIASASADLSVRVWLAP
ncbi:MAG TPA: serine/threonine-protein kinase [Ktedonobacterales bacterium]